MKKQDLEKVLKDAHVANKAVRLVVAQKDVPTNGISHIYTAGHKLGVMQMAHQITMSDQDCEKVYGAHLSGKINGFLWPESIEDRTITITFAQDEDAGYSMHDFAIGASQSIESAQIVD